MRSLDALKLSTTSITRFKSRSLVIVLTISALFGMLMTLNFLMNGIEKTAVIANGEQLGGKNYLVSQYKSQSMHESRFATNIEEWAEMTQVVEVGKRAQEKISDRASRYHGKIVGETWNIRTDRDWQIVTLDAVKDFVTEDLAKVPDDKIPILEQRGNKEYMASFNDGRELLPEITQVVGSFPAAEIERNLDEYGGWSYHPILERGNLLNYLLRKIDGGGSGQIIVVDDGSGKVQRLLQEQVEKLLAKGESISAGKVDKSLIIEFDNQDDAINYGLKKGILGISWPDMNPEISSYELFGGILNTAVGFNALRLKFLVAEIILIIVSIVIATVTFKHLLAQDVTAIALYRSLGAKTVDLYLIYFLYVLELCLLAVVVCVGMAFALVGLVALMNGGALGARLQTYYQLSFAPKVYFYSFDSYFWLTIISILLVAPLTLGFSSSCFSDRFLSKKLKAS